MRLDFLGQYFRLDFRAVPKKFFDDPRRRELIFYLENNRFTMMFANSHDSSQDGCNLSSPFSKNSSMQKWAHNSPLNNFCRLDTL